MIDDSSRDRLCLYSFFHLNLAYSSIELEQRAEVIQRCYWPLLKLVEEERLPFGIEVSGYTLESIQQLDPQWVEAFRQLCAEGLCELIGSGYAQLIGPLVPAEVNRHNQRLGLQTYRHLLDTEPQVALVNEQAWSAGMVRHYLESGYKAILMEWENPFQGQHAWNAQWGQLPQYACDGEGNAIPVIWNRSVAFQKIQRLAHGEMSQDEYLRFLSDQRADLPAALCLYGNDVEVFDFRPGRFHTEAQLEGRSEWRRIGDLYRALKHDDAYRLLAPSQLLGLLDAPGAGRRLHLQSPNHPVPVKKQPKYNIARWALSGRDDLSINSSCYRLYKRLEKQTEAMDAHWKELCYLWSSDFRTHITERRWRDYLNRLDAFEAEVGPSAVERRDPPARTSVQGGQVVEEGALIAVATPAHRVCFNKRRGLAVTSWGRASTGSDFWLGTLPHGFFDDINFAADYYSGLSVFEAPGRHKVADLNPAEVDICDLGDRIRVRGLISTELGALEKVYLVHKDCAEIEIEYSFKWPQVPNGSLRLGTVTLNPELFSRDSLFVRTCNGGEQAECFCLEHAVDHGAPVSSLVSSNQGFGMTSGTVAIGDANRWVEIEADMAQSAVLAQVLMQPIADSYLCRLSFSAQEMDDTALKIDQRETFDSRSLSFVWRLKEAGI